MRSSRANGGPFPIRLYFTTAEIDTMCSDKLEEVGLFPNTPEPIRIERLVEKGFTTNVGYEDLPEGCLGLTGFDKNGAVQCVRLSSSLASDTSAASERRARSTWAHEAGHCLLHPSLFIEDATMPLGLDLGRKKEIDRRILCRASDVTPVSCDSQRRYDGRWWEWQANRAIGGFLLPKPLVLDALKPFQSAPHSPIPTELLTKVELSLAEIFDVNPVAVRIRLKELFPDPGHAQLGL